MRRLRALGLWLGLLASAPAATAAENAFRLIGVVEVPKGLSIGGAPFGGISGIDYDPATRAWLMISDDRSDKAPARFYTARLDYDAQRVGELRLEAVTALKREDGSAFPSSSAGQGERVDAEALRLDPRNGQIVWATEGDPDRAFDPALRWTDRQGAPRGRIPLPRELGFEPAGASGARRNRTVEGLSFSANGRFLWLSMEAPLIQDGPASTLSATGLARITRLDRQGGVATQYAYPLDPVQAATAGRSDNGISEILAIDERRMLVLERSGVEAAPGRFTYHCRLYLVDVDGAQNVHGLTALTRATVPLSKRLLINFDQLTGVDVGNLEAMAWGPLLKDDRRSLVLMADDNFDPQSSGALLVFAVARSY